MPDCLKCGYQWKAKPWNPNPERCPHCKTAAWMTPKGVGPRRLDGEVDVARGANEGDRGGRNVVSVPDVRPSKVRKVGLRKVLKVRSELASGGGTVKTPAVEQGAVPVDSSGFCPKCGVPDGREHLKWCPDLEK